jgi:hypothetical protein
MMGREEIYQIEVYRRILKPKKGKLTKQQND